MRRRALIAGLAAAAAWRPLAGYGQPSKPLLAMLSPTSPSAIWDPFWVGMRALGRSRNDYTVETRWAEGHPDRLPDLAAELVRLDPRIILCAGSEAGVAAKRATATVPIVLAISSDPIAAGLVAGLARPGGNVTGLSLASSDLAGKHIQLLRTLAPHMRNVAILSNPHDPTHLARAAALIQAAQSVGVEAFAASASSVDQIGEAFAEISRRNGDALIVLGTPIFNLMANDISRLAIERKLPSLGDSASGARLGVGMIGYGADVRELVQRAAYYVDRILKGANPADLPVEQPTRFELVINLKIAKALGLAIPPRLMGEADDVIE